MTLFATKSSKRSKQLLAHSVSIEIYSSIALFPCSSTACLFKGVLLFIQYTCISLLFILKQVTKSWGTIRPLILLINPNPPEPSNLLTH